MAIALLLPGTALAQQAFQDFGNGYTYTPGPDEEGGTLERPDGGQTQVQGSSDGWSAKEPDGTVDTGGNGSMSQDSEDDQDQDDAIAGDNYGRPYDQDGHSTDGTDETSPNMPDPGSSSNSPNIDYDGATGSSYW